MNFTFPKDPVTKLCALMPVLVAIYLTHRGLASLTIGSELVWILTALFGALSYLLSQALVRLLEVRQAVWMRSAVIALALVYMATETFFAHLGLKWFLVDQAQLGTLQELDPLLWFFSIALSVTNVFTKWAFLATPETAGEEAARTAGPRLVHDAERAPDKAMEAALAKIGDRVRAGLES